MTRALIAVRARLARGTDSGATAVEYGLMVSLIAVAIIGTVTILGTTLSGLFTTVTGSL
jgi:pilus assembly protein Flp/PilA